MTSECPGCGDRYERVSQHWSGSACGYPDASALRDVLDGLALAGATVAGNGSNRNLTIGTISERLAAWTCDQLDWLCHGVRVETYPDANREHVHRVRTAAHPAINRYERWAALPANSGRRPPERYQLTPAAARVWHAHSGGLQWASEYDSSRVCTISAKRDERAAWIRRVLDGAGIDATRVGTRVQLGPRATDEWLDWIGDPVPGVEHKWSDSRARYRALRAADE